MKLPIYSNNRSKSTGSDTSHYFDTEFSIAAWSGRILFLIFFLALPIRFLNLKRDKQYLCTLVCDTCLKGENGIDYKMLQHRIILLAGIFKNSPTLITEPSERNPSAFCISCKIGIRLSIACIVVLVQYGFNFSFHFYCYYFIITLVFWVK